jgi:5,10-methylenetetrahydromethanopterin reductase
MAVELGLLTFPLPGLAAAMARMIEAAGWDALYFADTQNLAADVYVSLGAAAEATERITLATGVTNPVSRHPAVTASAIAAVQVASGGRAVLGIGRGDSSLGHLGRGPASVADLRRYVTRVRGYLHGEPVDLDGYTSTNEWIAATGQPPVPIDIAATGPKMTALAGELGDRATFAVGADPGRLAASIAHARRARAAAGLDPASLSVGAYVNAVAHPDPAMARTIVRGSAAAFAHFSGMPGAPTATLADRTTFERLGADYRLAGHATAGAAHAAALDDAFLDRFAVVGTAAACAARLRTLLDVGLDRLVIVPGSRDAPPAEMLGVLERLASEVIPALR